MRYRYFLGYNFYTADRLTGSGNAVYISEKRIEEMEHSEIGEIEALIEKKDKVVKVIIISFQFMNHLRAIGSHETNMNNNQTTPEPR